jgi:imidazole glycerol-phosphate synthase subunit HisH
MPTINKKVTVIDYGMGNLFNVVRALESIECNVCVTNDINTIIKSEKLLLPGVGAFEDGIRDLKENNLDSAIKEFTQTGKPLLGICLGMQLLMTSSEENGIHNGLDLIKGKVIRFKNPNDYSIKYKIPQIGWNELLTPNKKTNSFDNKHWEDSILKHLGEKLYMYFLHSYYVEPEDEQIILSETSYGGDLFCSAYQKDNIIGCQFHPERSGEQGLKILKNFLTL